VRGDVFATSYLLPFSEDLIKNGLQLEVIGSANYTTDKGTLREVSRSIKIPLELTAKFRVKSAIEKDIEGNLTEIPLIVTYYGSVDKFGDELPVTEKVLSAVVSVYDEDRGEFLFRNQSFNATRKGNGYSIPLNLGAGNYRYYVQVGSEEGAIGSLEGVVKVKEKAAELSEIVGKYLPLGVLLLVGFILAFVFGKSVKGRMDKKKREEENRKIAERQKKARINELLSRRKELKEKINRLEQQVRFGRGIEKSYLQGKIIENQVAIEAIDKELDELGVKSRKTLTEGSTGEEQKTENRKLKTETIREGVGKEAADENRLAKIAVKGEDTKAPVIEENRLAKIWVGKKETKKQTNEEDRLTKIRVDDG
jgi:hypothetical protein